MEEKKAKKVVSKAKIREDLYNTKAKMKGDDGDRVFKVHTDDSFVYRISHSKYVRWSIYMLMILGGAFLFTQSGLKNLIVSMMIALIPLFIGVGIAWVLNPTVKFIEKKGIRRKYGAIIAFILVAIIFLGLAALFVPMASVQIEAFTKMFFDAGPNGFKERITKFAVEYFGQDYAEFRSTVNSIWKDGQEYLFSFATANGASLLLSLGTGLLALLMGVTIGFYLLSDYDTYIEGVKKMLPDTNASSSRLLTKLHITIMSWFKGWIVDQGFIFIGSLAFLYFFGIEQWLVLAIIMVATNLIPFVGPFIGIGFVAVFLSVMLVGSDDALVHVLFGYSVPPMVALVGVILGLVIIQTIESTIIIPVAYKKAVKIHPVTILASLSIVSTIFSPFLTPLTIPTLAAFKTIYKHYTGKDLRI